MTTENLLARLDLLLAADDTERALRYPAIGPARQPIHTVYLPADRFDAQTIVQWRTQALAALDEHGPVPGFGDLDDRIRAKLAREPIEDLRIDFEDGYGIRSDEEEDDCAVRSASALRSLIGAGQAPPYTGIRIKCLEPGSRARSVRTLVRFLDELLPATSGASAAVPDGFRLTLPKVTSVVQVEAMVLMCEELEGRYDLPDGSLRFEIQIETPQAILSAAGTATVAPMLHAAAGRCVGLHYGTYDYSASVGVAAAFQSMEHPAADYAKAVMQVAAAGTGVVVSDGSTNILPVGDRRQVLHAWQLHARLVRRSLERGFYQGWDLHPAQLPTRYAATYRFYGDGVPVAQDRLHRYLQRVDSGVLDEPATAKALAAFLLRALESGAISDEEDSLLNVATLVRVAEHGI